MSNCLIPSIPDDIIGDGRWLSMHKRYISETKSYEPDIIFIGDSIIQGLQFSTLWNEKINPLHCLNFGIGGDKVQNVLWRLLNGEIDFHISIKAVVLFVGTNNLDNTPQEVFEGILECVKVIKNKLNEVQIVIPTLLPRGQFPNPLRTKNAEVNQLLINEFPNSEYVHVVQIDKNIIQSDGSISHYILYDYLHLTDNGYTKIWMPVYEKLKEILKTKQ